MLRLINSLLAMLVVLTACTGSATPEPTPDVIDLVTESAARIRATQTFRMTIELTGAPYYVLTSVGNVAFRRAVAQYVAPDVMQANVRIIVEGIPADLDVFSRGDNQWFRSPVITANRWFNAPFAEGFNPRSLIAEETGFQAALGSLLDLRLVGSEQLEDGTPVYHLQGVADGPSVTALMVGMIEAEGNVLVDAYIHRETLYPVRFVIVQPDTVTPQEPEPTTWTVDIYDINAEPVLDPPDA